MKLSTKKRTVDILSQMYPAYTSETRATKAIDWPTFVKVTADVGFSAGQDGGSAVIFEAKRHWNGKIIFHRHHPITKIGRVVFRSIGQRMKKWDRWDRGVFYVENKASREERWKWRLMLYNYER